MTWVSANFADLDGLQQGIARTTAGLDGEHQNWAAVVRGLADAWPDAAGMNFQDLNAAAVAFDKANVEFLGMLGVGVGRANETYMNTLATATKLIPS